VVIVEQFVVVIVRFVPCFVNITPKVVILLQNNKQTNKQTKKQKNKKTNKQTNKKVHQNRARIQTKQEKTTAELGVRKVSLKQNVARRV
jgi:hypothetical protein